MNIGQFWIINSHMKFIMLVAVISWPSLLCAQEAPNLNLEPLEKSWPASTHDNSWPEPVLDTQNYLYLQADRLETAMHDGDDSYRWDIQGWYGGDYNKLWLKSEGEGTFTDKPEEFVVQVLYSRALTAFWDIQAGLRYDLEPDPERVHAVLGFQGLAPYLFEVDAASFISENGEVQLRAELEYELLLSQRLILQPRLEVSAALQSVPELEVGSGLNSTNLGVRLRYEIIREFAPYIGVSWSKLHGESAVLAEASGEDSSGIQFLLGFRVWY